MDGVAYTVGKEIDDDHKEIHFSLDYIEKVSSNSAGRQKHEIQGVLVHEMVHCWQWNAQGTCPTGLIEGIADFVRLKAGLDPPHWEKVKPGSWDSGYQHTAYFLEWLEGLKGEGTVKRLNQLLRGTKYVEEKFWIDLVGQSVQDLWQGYKESMGWNDKEEKEEREKEKG